ncbi:MAG TPA: secondary thiamine-phosphate synthase enzyme YjbQ [Syntrophomonadaceae bacterium]|nr:secondary thiamine-phosphate synthase enzyme YjbQ [Syntrophomonadaceae bacterium]
MLYEFSLKTEKENLYNITNIVQEAVTKGEIESGTCLVFCPHTTAGITINENADPDVIIDILLGLDKAFPDRKEFRHAEGNSSAHLKASCIGASQTIIIDDGQLVLGTWQGIFFCEFDGPRIRKFYVQVR